jgi:hypothetical protein
MYLRFQLEHKYLTSAQQGIEQRFSSDLPKSSGPGQEAS